MQTHTAETVRDALIAIAEGYRTEQRAVPAAPKNEKYARKAAAIRDSMIGHCIQFPKYTFGREGDALTAFQQNRVFTEWADTADLLFPGARERCDALDPVSRSAFMAFACPAAMLYTFFYAEQQAVLTSLDENAVPGNPDEIFRARVVTSTLGEILTGWRMYWNTLDLLPCPPFYWEVSNGSNS